MATMHTFATALASIAAKTTLSGGAIAFLIDQRRDGISLTVTYSLRHGLKEGDQLAYCEAAEKEIVHCLDTECIPRINTSRYCDTPKSLNEICSVCSRHAILICWDQDTWVQRKTDVARRFARMDRVDSEGAKHHPGVIGSKALLMVDP